MGGDRRGGELGERIEDDVVHGELIVGIKIILSFSIVRLDEQKSLSKYLAKKNGKIHSKPCQNYKSNIHHYIDRV